MQSKNAVVESLNCAILSSCEGVILYGAGVNAANFIIKCKKDYPDIKILCIVDTDKSKQGNCLLGIPVRSPESLAVYNAGTCVIVTPNKNFVSITDTIKSAGFSNIFYYSRYNALMSDVLEVRDSYVSCNRDLIKNLLMDNNDQIAAARRYFEHDERSVAVFDAKLESSFYSKHAAIEALWESNQYFPGDIIKLTNNEVFVDCGGYDGATSLDFIKRVEGYGYIYVFEPDPWQYEVTKWMMENKKISSCDVYNMGAYDRTEKLTFSAKEWGSGNINPDGDILIEAVSLDALLYDKPHRPTFIKMDIEGAELNALKGAYKLIERDKPKLAISVYHGMPNTHLWEIPFWVKSNFPEYNIFLRQHALVNETVLYAV